MSFPTGRWHLHSHLAEAVGSLVNDRRPPGYDAYYTTSYNMLDTHIEGFPVVKHLVKGARSGVNDSQYRGSKDQEVVRKWLE